MRASYEIPRYVYPLTDAEPRRMTVLRHDLVRLRWEEDDAYSRLLDEIRKNIEASRAFQRWQSAHERRQWAEERLARARDEGESSG